MNQEANCEVKYTEVSDSAVMALVPVVSIHMITYNHGQYLAEAIEGVIAQKTDFPIELIIGEDCSTDNTREIALDYQRRYPHLIRVIYSEHNVGMHGNFRRVLDACRGEFIALCEGDDYWINPEKLSEQVAVLSRMTNIDITFHSCYIKYEKQQTLNLSHVHASTDKIITCSEVVDGDRFFLMGFMSTATIMVRRSLLLSIQDWFDVTLTPVLDHIVQVFGSRNGAYYLNRPMSVYRTEVQGSWSERIGEIDAYGKTQIEFLFMFIKLKQAIPEQKEAFQRCILSCCADLLIRAKKENFIQLRELFLSVHSDIYELKEIDSHNIEYKRLEWEYFKELAVDSGKTKILSDKVCGISWQLFRVVKSLFIYGTSVLKSIKTNQSVLGTHEKMIEKWKTEVQRGYLIARWQNLGRLILNDLRTFG